MSKVQQQREKIGQLVAVGLLSALVVVFQTVSNFVKVGPVSVTLTLIPVVLGGCLLGRRWGAVLGFVFGLIVTVFVLSGTDVGGYMLFAAKPVTTVALCLIKGTAAGFAAACIFAALKNKNQTVAVTLAAMTAPVVNTGIFTAAMLLIYPDTLAAWAGGSDILLYVLTGLVGINFAVEFIASAVLSPVLVSVLRSTRHT